MPVQLRHGARHRGERPRVKERTVRENLYNSGYPALYRVTLYRNARATQWEFDADEFPVAQSLYDRLSDGDDLVVWEVQY
jgi:hypothetical protein